MKRIKSDKIILKDNIVSGYVYFEDDKIFKVTNEELPFVTEEKTWETKYVPVQTVFVESYYMGLNMSGSFNSSCWINGYGWIAVALVIFANWSPALAMLGTFVFGFFNTLRVSGSSLAAAFPGTLGWLSAVPTQVYQALPFVITAIVLVISSIKNKKGSGQPAGLGLNYFREER